MYVELILVLTTLAAAADPQSNNPIEGRSVFEVCMSSEMNLFMMQLRNCEHLVGKEYTECAERATARLAEGTAPTRDECNRQAPQTQLTPPLNFATSSDFLRTDKASNLIGCQSPSNVQLELTHCPPARFGYAKASLSGKCSSISY